MTSSRKYCTALTGCVRSLGKSPRTHPVRLTIPHVPDNPSIPYSSRNPPPPITQPPRVLPPLPIASRASSPSCFSARLLRAVLTWSPERCRHARAYRPNTPPRSRDLKGPNSRSYPSSIPPLGILTTHQLTLRSQQFHVEHIPTLHPLEEYCPAPPVDQIALRFPSVSTTGSPYETLPRG